MTRQEDLSKGVEKTIKLCRQQGFTDAEIAREVLSYEAKNRVVIKTEGITVDNGDTVEIVGCYSVPTFEPLIIDKVVLVKAKCPECGREYEYAEAVYEPKTCSTKECVQKHLHPELKRRR